MSNPRNEQPVVNTENRKTREELWAEFQPKP